jgi:hypothetical protein
MVMPVDIAVDIAARMGITAAIAAGDLKGGFGPLFLCAYLEEARKVRAPLASRSTLG